MTQSLSEVDVSNPEDVKALIASGGMDLLVHFGDEDFLTRYKAFEEQLPDWKVRYPKLASADMRYGDQIVLEMANGVAAPLAGDSPVAPTSADGSDASVAEKPVEAVKTPVKAIAKPVAKKAAPKPSKISAALAAARRPAGVTP